MVTTRLDLRGIAKEVLQKSLWEHKEYTGYQIAQKYGLNDAQLQRVKQYIKEMAAEMGCLWGYDDYLGRYRVCPDNDKQTAARMLRYAFVHWGRQGKSLRNLAHGARLQKLISPQLARELHEVPKQSEAAVARVTTKLLRIRN